jgi:ankyrin repeat protein
MPLSDLPREIILDIADHLHYKGVNALCCTNSQLYRLLNEYLYRRDLTQSGGRSLLWAAERADREPELIRESTSTAQWALDASRHFDQIPECYQFALQIAAGCGHAPLVELLLKIDGINPNFARHGSGSGTRGFLDMLVATSKINHPTVSAYYGGSPLLHACKRGHVSIVKQLLARDDVDANAGGFYRVETPLLVACGNFRVHCEDLGLYLDESGEEIANLLLDKAGIDVNTPDMDGNTPLMLAARHGKMSVLKSLLARNDLNPNILNSKGDHVLGCSAYKGDFTTVMLLLGHPHTDLNLVMEGGRSALMLACKAGNPDIVELLLSREGIAINQQDTDGLTALCHVTETGYSHAYRTGGHAQAAKLLDLLLEKDGINPNPRDNNGRTPLARVCLRPVLYFSGTFSFSDPDLRQFVAFVRSLLSHRDIDPNAVDNNSVSILADVINKVIPHRSPWE